MRYLDALVTCLPKTLKALNDNLIGAMVLVCCAAFVLVAFVVHRLR